MFKLSRCGLLTADVAMDDAQSNDALFNVTPRSFDAH